jgi:uncharacterized membrane protein YoaK (UPF0700 family)
MDNKGIVVVGLFFLIIGVLFTALYYRDATNLLPFGLSYAVILLATGICIIVYGVVRSSRRVR